LAGDPLARLHEKHRQCMELLRPSSHLCQPQGKLGAPVHSSGGKGGQLDGGEDQLIPGGAADGIEGAAKALADMRARHEQCVELAKEWGARGPREAPSSCPQNRKDEHQQEHDLLPVLLAQVAVNHVTELGALRRLREGLVTQAQYEGLRAEKEALMSQHEELLSQYSALREKHEALLAELRAQATQCREEPGLPAADARARPAAPLALAGAVAVASALLAAVRAGAAPRH